MPSACCRYGFLCLCLSAVAAGMIVMAIIPGGFNTSGHEQVHQTAEALNLGVGASLMTVGGLGSCYMTYKGWTDEEWAGQNFKSFSTACTVGMLICVIAFSILAGMGCGDTTWIIFPFMVPFALLPTMWWIMPGSGTCCDPFMDELDDDPSTTLEDDLDLSHLAVPATNTNAETEPLQPPAVTSPNPVPGAAAVTTASLGTEPSNTQPAPGIEMVTIPKKDNATSGETTQPNPQVINQLKAPAGMVEMAPITVGGVKTQPRVRRRVLESLLDEIKKAEAAHVQREIQTPHKRQ